jgi:hypothetical protein
MAQRARVASIAKGLTITLTGLKARSALTLRVRLAAHTLHTIHVRADRRGQLKVKLRLPRRVAARARHRTLKLRFSLTTAANDHGSRTRALIVR